MKGVIYILSNPFMDGLVKIGYTTQTLEERVAELNKATGIPGNFVVEAFFEVEEPMDFEKQIHRSLKSQRVRKQREFFKLPKNEAIKIVQEICRSPATRNTKIAPKRSPNYKNSRWLTSEQQEFNGIRKELWNVRKKAFEQSFLTDPNSRKPPVTFQGKIKEFFFGSEHDFRYKDWRLTSCQRVVNEMKGHIKQPYGRPGYVLCASYYSIARVYVSSAVDLHPERIKLILTALQKEESDIYTQAKQIYEMRHQQRVLTTQMEENFDKIEEEEQQEEQEEEKRVEWVETLDSLGGIIALDLKREQIPTDYVCDRCGSKMVRRWGKKGNFKGYFLVCSGYPKCRFIV